MGIQSFIMLRYYSIAVFLLFLAYSEAKTKVSSLKLNAERNRAPRSEGYDFTGCPFNNDFYYQGVITSPFYPSNYPPNIECYYFIQAQYGKLVSVKFSDFNLSPEDQVTVYDGQSTKDPVLARFGGNSTTSPTTTVISTTRFIRITFIVNSKTQQKGFSFNYNSVFNSNPCDRDIILIINGMSSSPAFQQPQFVQQLNFIANSLTPTWNVGLNRVRVIINLQVDDDFAVVWTGTDMPTNKDVTQTVLGLTDDVPDVAQNNNTSLNSLFRYAEGTLEEASEDKLRRGIAQTVIVFVAQNANDQQDFYEAQEYAHQLRTDYDTRVIVVAMGTGLDIADLSLLSFGTGYTFSAAWNNLASLTPQINKAICQNPSTTCGA